MTHYPKRRSRVDVAFHDGSIQSYEINAGATLHTHLTRQTAETGILSLLCGKTAHAIPLANIREWSMTEHDEE